MCHRGAWDPWKSCSRPCGVGAKHPQQKFCGCPVHNCQVSDLQIRDQQSHLSRGQSHVSGGRSQKQKWAEQQCKLQAGSGSERSKEEGSQHRGGQPAKRRAAMCSAQWSPIIFLSDPIKTGQEAAAAQRQPGSVRQLSLLVG